MSTLISDLDSTPGPGDGDFVASILNEMNGAGGGAPPPPQPQAPIQPPPVVGAYTPPQVISAPGPNSLMPHTMDNGPVTAHMIGNSHPTPADFAQMMAREGGGGQVYAAPQGGDGGVAAGAANYTSGSGVPAPRASGGGRKSWLSRIMDEFRAPLLVVILVFVFSLPVVNFLFAHYLPRMVKPTGELTLVGLLVKSAAAGAAFWTLQRVIVPLLSL